MLSTHDDDLANGGRWSSRRDAAKEDPLFLAITRPALMMGIPLEAAMLSVSLGAVLSIVLVGTLVLFVPLSLLGCLVCRVIAARDPLIFAMLFSWLRSRPRGAAFGEATSARWWGGVSMSPLAADVDERRRDRG